MNHHFFDSLVAELPTEPTYCCCWCCDNGCCDDDVVAAVLAVALVEATALLTAVAAAGTTVLDVVVIGVEKLLVVFVIDGSVTVPTFCACGGFGATFTVAF